MSTVFRFQVLNDHILTIFLVLQRVNSQSSVVKFYTNCFITRPLTLFINENVTIIVYYQSETMYVCISNISSFGCTYRFPHTTVKLKTMNRAAS